MLGLATPGLGSKAQHWLHEWDDAQGDVDCFVASDDPPPFNTATADSEMGNGRLTWNNVSGAPKVIDYGGTTAMGTNPLFHFQRFRTWLRAYWQSLR
jgi:hypothetical protein